MSKKPDTSFYASELVRFAKEFHKNPQAYASNAAYILRSAVRDGVHPADIAYELDLLSGLSSERANTLRDQAIYDRKK